MPSACTPPQHIVTIHHGGLGDLLFTLPALAALRAGFPGADLTAVVRAYQAPLLEGSELMDHVVVRPERDRLRQFGFLFSLLRGHFDLAIAFSQSRKSVLAAGATRAPRRIGYARAHLERLLTHRIPREGPYTIESNLTLVEAAGCPVPYRSYQGLVTPTAAAQEQAAQLLQQHGIAGRFVVAACEASGKRAIKEWPAKLWAASLGDLSKSLPVVLVGTRLSETVRQEMHQAAVDLGGCSSQPVVDLGGQTSLPVLAAICARADAFVGIDSGVMHLAAAMGTPVAGIFGPTAADLTGPRGVPHRIVRHPVECAPCHLVRCKWTGDRERECLTKLEPAVVVQAVHELLPQ